MKNITIRLAPGCVPIVLDAQPTRQHQADETMPRLAVNRKDTGGESIGGKVPRAAVHFSPRPLKALLLWRYRGHLVIPGRALFGAPGMTVHIAS
jgi:hypothetical protein